MRFLVSAAILLLLVLPTTVANATTLTEILPGIGSHDLFGVFGGHVTISSSGAIDVELKFNFPGNDLNGAFDPAEGITWMPGDLLFYSGSHLYGIPIVNHSLAPVGASGVFPSVTAFDVYSTDAFQTADQLLINTSITHRTGPTAVVWLGGTPQFLSGPLTHTITNTGDSSIGRFQVDMSGLLPTDFRDDVNANGFTVFFASTQCANGYLTGSEQPLPPPPPPPPPPPGVPEPASLVLFATGLLGMGGVMRRRTTRK